MDSNFGTALLEILYTIIITGTVYGFLTWSSAKEKTRAQRVRIWILFGFIINSIGLSWLFSAYPLPWLKEGYLQLVGILLLSLVMSAIVSIPYGIIAITHYPKIRQQFRPLIFASALVVAELFRSYGISLLFYKEGTRVALHFTAGTIGNALSTTPLIEFAYFGGTFALTFVLGYIIYSFHSKHATILYHKHLVVIVVLLFFVHFFIPVTRPAPGTVVGIITTNFQETADADSQAYLEAFRRQSKPLHLATLSLASSSPTFIVYPEDTRYLAYISQKEKEDLANLFEGTLLIDGDTNKKNDKLYNVSVFYSPKNDRAVGRGKELLLPFNEYIPIFFGSIFKLFVGADALEKYTALHTYTPIYSKKTIVFNNDTTRNRIGTLICSEIMSYPIIEQLKNEEPSLVFYQSQLSVFHNNPLFLMFLRSSVKVVGAELRTPLISSVSGAPSLIISQFGTVIRYMPSGFSTSTYTFK
jgi:apolipoprotein N-acyltransferase